jgi:hypothetical protein
MGQVAKQYTCNTSEPCLCPCQHSPVYRNPKPIPSIYIRPAGMIEMLKNEGYSIILCLDNSNENISCTKGSYHTLDNNDGTFIKPKTHNGTLSTLETTCGLVDSLALLQPPPFPSMYTYRKNRLDYIFIYQDISNAAL